MAKKRKRSVGRYCALHARKGSRHALRKALKKWMAEESKEARIARKMVCIAGAKKLSKKARKRLSQMVAKWHAQESREHKLANRLISLARKAIKTRGKRKRSHRKAKRHNPRSKRVHHRRHVYRSHGRKR